MRTQSGIAIALLALAQGAAAATTLESKNDGWDSTAFIDGNKLRVDTRMKGTGAIVMIFDGDRGKLVTLDPGDKTYTERTQAQMKAQMEGARTKSRNAFKSMPPEQRKKMEEMMANMPEAQRARMQEMMSGKPATNTQAPSKLEKTGKTRQVAGFPCEGFREVRAGKTVTEGCFIPWGAGAVSKGDLAVMKQMSEFMKAGMGAPMTNSPLTSLDTLPGYPGEFASLDEDGKPISTTTLTAVRHGSVPAGSFTIPAGFKQTERPGAEDRDPQ